MFPLYSKVKDRICKDIKNAGIISFTTDGWSSRATQSFITFTAHFLNESFENKKKICSTNKGYELKSHW